MGEKKAQQWRTNLALFSLPVIVSSDQLVGLWDVKMRRLFALVHHTAKQFFVANQRWQELLRSATRKLEAD